MPKSRIASSKFPAAALAAPRLLKYSGEVVSYLMASLKSAIEFSYSFLLKIASPRFYKAAGSLGRNCNARVKSLAASL